MSVRLLEIDHGGRNRLFVSKRLWNREGIDLMYTVLVAQDEPWVLRGIVEMVGAWSLQQWRRGLEHDSRSMSHAADYRHHDAEPPSAADVRLVERLKPALLEYEYNRTTPEDVRELAAAGLDVSLWTVNSRADALPFIEAGVTYITTDIILTD